MDRDLSSVMRANVDVRERSVAGAQPGAEALTVTVRRVRRRRAGRHAFQGVGVVAAVGLVAGVSWLGLRAPDDPKPAVNPSPSVSTTPTPSPTPTEAPVSYDEILGLPPTRALPPGLLEQSTTGWVLGIYASRPPQVQAPEGEGMDSVPGGLVNTVVPISPDGDMYRVVDLPVSMGVSLLRWHAGSTTATVSIDWDGDLGVGTEARAILDLTTGSITPQADGLDEYALYVGEAADGAELWRVPTSDYTSDVFRVKDGSSTPELVGGISYTELLDPTERWLATPAGDSEEDFALFDVVDGGRTEYTYGVPDASCEVLGWLDPGQLLAMCMDAGNDFYGPVDPVDAHAAYYRIDVGATGATATHLADLGASDPRPYRIWQGAWVRPGAVALEGTFGSVDACRTVSTSGPGTALPGWTSVPARCRPAPTRGPRSSSRPRHAMPRAGRRRCRGSTARRAPGSCWLLSRRRRRTSRCGRRA